MAKAKVFTGARAKIFVEGILVGQFDSCSYSVSISVEPIHILGRFSAAEIAPTAYEAVPVNCSGFRIIGHGAHILPKAPKLQDLLNLENVTLSMSDRQAAPDAEPVMVVLNCVATNWSGGVNAKATSRTQISYLGTHAADESGAQDEGDAVNLPS